MVWESRALVDAYKEGKKEGILIAQRYKQIKIQNERFKSIRQLMKFEIFNEGQTKEKAFKKIMVIYPDQYDLEFLEQVYTSINDEA